MGRVWTPEERKRHLRKKYFTWKEKIFVLVIFMLAILTILALLFTGIPGELGIQITSVGLLFVTALLIVLVIWGGDDYKMHATILAVIAILLLVIVGILLAGNLSGFEQVVAYVILGIVFLVVVAASAFFIDIVHYESV